jgi:PknH-like extracellular domain
MQQHQRQSNPHRDGSSMPGRRATVAVGVICCMLSMATSSCHRNSADNDTHPPSRAIDAAALLVSVADADHLAGINNLRVNPKVESNHPRSPHSTPPGACRVLDPTVAFGSEWAQFRTAVYNGAPAPAAPQAPATAATAPAPARPLLLSQSVGIYPDQRAARAAFDRLAPALAACSSLHANYYDFTVSQPDNSTVALEYPSGIRNIFRVKSSILIYVDAAGFAHSDQLAQAVIQTISDRI